MGKTFRRTVGAVLALCLLLGSGPVSTRAANPGGVEYVNTYKNTGNQRQDIIGVALTQLGYREKYENDTRFGDWCGYPFQPWCAAFVSWCARQAEVSGNIIKKNARANPTYFNIPYYHGKNYTPKPGDLFFTEKFSHTGIVWYVEGEYFYCIEGNAEPLPMDPDADSYHVVTNKRKINKHYFGVPAYLGSTGEHTYVRGYDAAHPHKVYYKCTDCGSSYYNGQTEILPDCSSCYSCGCSSSGSGYYLISTSSGPIKLRNSHSTSAKHTGYVSNGAAVYVHGTTGSWAYVEYDGQRGHIQTKYLQKYKPIPGTPQLKADQPDYLKGETAVLSWSAPAGTEQYRLEVCRNDAVYLQKNTTSETTCTLKDLPVGEYVAKVIACNRSGASVEATLEFTVRDTYTITYALNGGTAGPPPQTQKAGQSVKLSSTVPRRTGYTFLGWTEESGGKLATYDPAASFVSYDNVTLYAVWKSDAAALQSVTLATLPIRRVFLLGETLDTQGLTLELGYTDGSGHRVSQGYSCTGFDAQSYGQRTVTVTYEGFSATYAVAVAPYIPGDMDSNKLVDRDDVMQLLWHISFPENFPMTVPVDLNNDQKANRDDVMLLLWHVTFPEAFPLEIFYEVER